MFNEGCDLEYSDSLYNAKHCENWNTYKDRCVSVVVVPSNSLVNMGN